MWPSTKLWADNDGKGKQKKIGYICEVPCVPCEDTDSSNAWEDELRRFGPCEGINYIKLHFDDIAVLVSRQPIGLFSAECRLALASTESTGSPSAKYEHRRTSALLSNIQNIRICMGKNLSFP